MIAQPLLDWYQKEGGKDFPWHVSDPYKVWVSEIMLQQTQVRKVLNYYRTFIQSFPRIQDLAAAPLDDLMSHWSGLGYYARAHNLHEAAQIVVTKHEGKVPDDIGELMQLPGIGRSTAGAILSLAYGIRYPILDTNVKRVLIRYFAISEESATRLEKILWRKAEKNLPHRDIGRYNQAMMNLGASICRPYSPLCHQCPLEMKCKGKHLVEELPRKKEKSVKQSRLAYFAFVMNSRRAILLERRPPIGIWRSLWCPPQFDNPTQLQARLQQFGEDIGLAKELAPLRHSFSHFHLLIQPILFLLRKDSRKVPEDNQIWYSIGNQQKIGMPTPIKRLITRILE